MSPKHAMAFLAHRPRFARSVAVLSLALLTPLWSGCQSSGPKRPTTEIPADAPPDTARALGLTAEGLAAYDAGKLDQAIVLYQQALTADESVAATWINLGTALHDKNDFMGAGQAWVRAAELAPGDPRPLFNLGMAYETRGWPAEALRHYENALIRQPNDLDSLRALFRVSRQLRKDDQVTLDRVRRLLLLENDAKWRREATLYMTLLENAARERATRDARLHRDASGSNGESPAAPAERTRPDSSPPPPAGSADDQTAGPSSLPGHS